MSILERIHQALSDYLEKKEKRESWDRELNRSIDMFGLKEVSRYKAVTGPFEIWIENYPYCYAHEYDGSKEVQPSRKTKRRICGLLRSGPESTSEYKSRLDEYIKEAA